METIRKNLVSDVRQRVAEVVVGQDVVVERLLIALFTGGHLLLQGMPGLAKTLLVQTISKTIDLKFSRVQFTIDLLPSDILGSEVIDQRTNEFTTHLGPIFTNLLLADEINRAAPKVQSALLEAMQERQITIGGESHELPRPFLVLATQNPIEQEGTYPLPEAQVDRFLMKVMITYPSKEEERAILQANLQKDGLPKPQAVVNDHDILEARELVRSIYLDEKVEQYIVDLVCATRNPEECGLGHLKHLISFGASPRASIGLGIAAKAHAFLHHRGFVTPEDVRAVAMDVMRHRIGTTFEAEAENIRSEQILLELMDHVEIP